MRICSREPADESRSFTSMIDVVFLLLIFFVLQPFRSLEMKLDSELPTKDGPGEPGVRFPIRLEVRPDPGGGKHAARFRVNRTNLGADWRRIAPALISECCGDRDIPVRIAPDQAVHFENVLMALDQCHVAEMRKVSFAAPLAAP